jgi:stage V sporulation protein S
MSDLYEHRTATLVNSAKHMEEMGVDDTTKADVIKVSAKSRSTAVAGAIAAVMREHHYAEVQAIGAGAVNQAVKALAIARGYLTGDQIDIVCTPFFTEVDIDGQERTAVRFTVEPRPPTR